jgi:cyclic pyranopterin phosphate synthase
MDALPIRTRESGTVVPEGSRPTHFAPDGSIAMVDVGAKAATERLARASATVRMSGATEDVLKAATLAKGDAFAVAQIAGIMAAKRTSELIPLTHSLPLSHVEISFAWPERGLLHIEATARTISQTGVEMEALTAASVAALTIYDMLKSVERGVVIEGIRLLEKRGGKSGTWLAPGEQK